MQDKLNVKRLALTAGIYAAVCVAAGTAAGILGIPGFQEFSKFLISFYGFYGYSMTWTGVLVGAFWGFIEGSIHVGIFAWIYNRMSCCGK